ncbi:MAG: efflux RND transporter periplasmic adaptor subunit [Deltaproteobacteria bacterium]|nr:MAG: efflux RND transporter periplasmic adaptor subunit [Deltaproteobacteria bacterium]
MSERLLMNPFRLILVGTITCASLFGFGIASSRSQKGPPPAPVKVARVSLVEIAPQVLLIGTAQPRLTSVVASDIDGLVEEFNPNEGDFVKKGAVLARLEDSLLQIQLKGAKASKADTEAQLRRARADLKRSSELLASETIADKQYTDDLAEVQSLEARVLRLEAEIEHDKDSIAKKIIRAPFSGFVVKEHTQIGQWVDKGGPIVTVADLSSMEVVVDVPERYVSQLALGGSTRVEVDALDPGKFRGRIAAIIPVGDAASRSFPVKVSIDNPENRIKGGMLCRVSLAIGKPNSVLAVPKDAVVNMGQEHLLFVVHDGVAQPLPVQLGDASDSMIEVKGPLEPGMQVVTRGNERLRPGQPVQVIK